PSYHLYLLTLHDALPISASNPGDDSLLQCSQNLGLRREAHVADLVEEQGSPVRELELARAILVRSGERALHVAKQLRLDQFGGRSEEHTSELQSRENLVC